MQAFSQGIIVSTDQFYDNCLKGNTNATTTPCFDAYLCEYLLELLVVSVNLVLDLSVRLLFLYSFKGPFNTHLIYFTFIKSVAINKDLSQPLI